MVARKYFKIYLRFLSRNIQSSIEYKVDFLLGILANLFQSILGLVFIWVIFNRIPTIKGWNFHEVAFVYGFAIIPSGISELFLNNVWLIPTVYVNQGNLDRILTKPLNPLFHIIADGFEPHGFGFVIFGVVLYVYSSLKLGLSFSLLNILYFVVMTVSGTIIYFSINLFMATLSFWLMDVVSSMVLVHHLSEFAKYPLIIYHKAVQITLTWIIPYAFTAFFPAAFLLKKGSLIFSFLTPAVAILIFLIAYSFWNFGLRRYQSSGS